ncbi:40S small subunit processome assembly factor 1 [Aulostomus maculatus]
MDSSANGKEDDDCAFLEHVLDKLYDFGNGSATKNKSRKKKKRNRCEEEEGGGDDSPTADGLCCSHGDKEAERRVAAPQQTKSEDTGVNVRQGKQVEVVTFQDPSKKQRTKKNTAPGSTPPPQTAEEKQSGQLEGISLEKARLEVHRFGITGYKKEQQRVFERDRAVMLGARPPKKEHLNYKTLQQQIRERKQKAKEEVEPDLKKTKKKKHQRDKKKVSSGPDSAPLGQVGRFKNGMLILSSKEIQKIKGKKGGK